MILTWNDGCLVQVAVDSALASTGVDVEVTVVDNGSEPPAVVADHPRVAVIRNATNRGVAPARNQGAAASHAPFLLFLDSDATLAPDALGRLCDTVGGAPDIAVAVPVFSGQPIEASAGRAPGAARKLARLAGLTDVYVPSVRPAGAKCWDVDFGIGACQLIRREAFEQVGGLDETFFYGPEDLDFCLRIGEAGWRVVQVGDAGCMHPPRRRNRRIVTRRGLRHGWAVCRHLWRHRRHSRGVASRLAAIEGSDESGVPAVATLEGP